MDEAAEAIATLNIGLKGSNIPVSFLEGRRGRIGGMAFCFLYLAVRILLSALVRRSARLATARDAA